MHHSWRENRKGEGNRGRGERREEKRGRGRRKEMIIIKVSLPIPKTPPIQPTL